MPVLDTQKLIEDRVGRIQLFHLTAGTDKAELDVSGGVDSAVMLGLLVRALGSENVTAVYSDIMSSAESKQRAEECATAFGVKLITLNLSPIFESLVNEMLRGLKEAGYDIEEIDYLIEQQPLVLGSLRSCLRAPIGRGMNRLTDGGIRHGTGNEDEDRWLRFYQKGGDGEVDTNPIETLSKGEVFQLARALGVPRSILTARPSPDLWAQGERHNDEDEITAFVGFDPKDFGLTWYSYVDPDTGEYKNVGLIERISRFLDTHYTIFEPETKVPTEIPISLVLFSTGGMLPVIEAATEFAPLKDLPRSALAEILDGVRRVERVTKHKLNPNIPMLGTREELIAAGILTNNLF